MRRGRVLSAAAWGGRCHVTGGADPAASCCCRDVGLGSSPTSLGRQRRLSCKLWGSPTGPRGHVVMGVSVGGCAHLHPLPRDAVGMVQVTGARRVGRAGGGEAGVSPQPWPGCQGPAAMGDPGWARGRVGAGVQLGPGRALRPRSGACMSSDGRCPRRRAPFPWGCSRPAW